jgi:xanthine dehydrogenase accessory factor
VLGLERMDEAARAELRRAVEAEDERQPHVYLFGGGHVGQALAAALSLLPVRVHLVETRQEALEGLPGTTRPILTPVPEEVVPNAPAGSAFVILTHDHALDFLIVAAALARSDAAYVGMIGSRTKRATFRRWYLKEHGGRAEDEERLVSPIGGRLPDKRPAVIAAMVAAEVMQALAAIN